ncbi:hypothetical protein NX059_003367 [Plenodomus lindquistii]|nr:hypothetical protein NX059_003367 [Plenodomus lindquistii]
MIMQTVLVKSYILGERLMDTEYQNAIIRVLIQTYRSENIFPATTTTRMVYEATTATSPLLALFVDIWVWAANHSWLPRDLETVGLEFSADIINAMNAKLMSPEQGLEAAREYQTNPTKLQTAARPPWIFTPEKYEIIEGAMPGPNHSSGSWGVQ